MWRGTSVYTHVRNVACAQAQFEHLHPAPEDRILGDTTLAPGRATFLRSGGRKAGSPVTTPARRCPCPPCLQGAQVCGELRNRGCPASGHPFEHLPTQSQVHTPDGEATRCTTHSRCPPRHGKSVASDRLARSPTSPLLGQLQS